MNGRENTPVAIGNSDLCQKAGSARLNPKNVTTVFSALSLKAPWNCVTIKLQKPRCQGRSGVFVVTKGGFYREAALGAMSDWMSGHLCSSRSPRSISSPGLPVDDGGTVMSRVIVPKGRPSTCTVLCGDSDDKISRRYEPGTTSSMRNRPSSSTIIW